MTLIACPKCGRKVLSVASVCPNCSFSLTEQRAIDAQKGNGVRCHQCQQALPASTSVCPNCGEARRPDLRWRWLVPGAALAVLVAVALFVLPKVTADRPQQTEAIPPEEQLPARPDSGQTQTTADASRPAVTPPSVTADSPTESQRTDPVSPLSGRLTETRWTRTWVNLREGRGTSASVVRILRRGERLEVASFYGGWWAVYQDGQHVGYVANSELQDQPPI
jgi:RNA polymerase subunit RPABC4/transcription elongation factor Spt4